MIFLSNRGGAREISVGNNDPSARLALRNRHRLVFSLMTSIGRERSAETSRANSYN
jgi:hypothetical protein